MPILKLFQLLGVSFLSEVSKKMTFRDTWTLFLQTDVGHHFCLKWFKTLPCVRIKNIYDLCKNQEHL